MHLNEELFNSAFNLVKTNMKDLYIDTWVQTKLIFKNNLCKNKGWNDNKKMKEMKRDTAKYIMAIDSVTKALLGLLYFQFLIEDNRACVYWYLFIN